MHLYILFFGKHFNMRTIVLYALVARSLKHVITGFYRSIPTSLLIQLYIYIYLNLYLQCYGLFKTYSDTNQRRIIILNNKAWDRRSNICSNNFEKLSLTKYNTSVFNKYQFCNVVLKMGDKKLMTINSYLR